MSEALLFVTGTAARKNARAVLGRYNLFCISRHVKLSLGLFEKSFNTNYQMEVTTHESDCVSGSTGFCIH